MADRNQQYYVTAINIHFAQGGSPFNGHIETAEQRTVV